MIVTTIIKVVDNHGTIGRCDAKCHEAELPDCHCVCGGAFHGVGTEIAVEDRSFLTDDEILENIKTSAGSRARVFRKPEQKELF